MRRREMEQLSWPTILNASFEVMDAGSLADASVRFRPRLVAPGPLDHVGERSSLQIGPQVVGEGLDGSLLPRIGAAGTVRRDHHTPVLPHPSPDPVLQL